MVFSHVYQSVFSPFDAFQILVHMTRHDAVLQSNSFMKMTTRQTPERKKLDERTRGSRKHHWFKKTRVLLALIKNLYSTA